MRKADLEGTLATLVENPSYEFWPAGLRMTGREPVRRSPRECPLTGVGVDGL